MLCTFYFFWQVGKWAILLQKMFKKHLKNNDLKKLKSLKPAQVVHELEGLPHMRLVEGVNPAVRRVLLWICGAVETRRGRRRRRHQTGETWEAVSGSAETHRPDKRLVILQINFLFNIITIIPFIKRFFYVWIAL